MNSEIDFHERQLKEWDLAIREGRASEIRAQCRELKASDIPRNLLKDYAQIARRLGEPSLIIRWLRAVVRTDQSLTKPASVEEKALYGLGLSRLGAYREAAEILYGLNAEDFPEIYFFRTSLNFNQWNYSKGIADLNKYIRHKDLSPYSKLVGRLNRCAALVYLGKEELAHQEIEKLERILRVRGFHLLRGNLLEVRAQLHIDQSRLEEARRDLQEASSILKKADARSQLFVKKWEGFIEAKSTTQAKAVAAIEEVRQQAANIKDWETLRDCDFQLSLLLKDKDLFLKVYWSTGLSKYKQRMVERFDLREKIQNQYIWFSPGATESSPLFDLVQMAPSPLLKKLFFELTRDFYRPLQTTELSDRVYTNEYYNAETTPLKVHRLLQRGRQWLMKNQIPIDIESDKKNIRLLFNSPCRLLLYRKQNDRDQAVLPTGLVEMDKFTVHDVGHQMNLSERTARRLVAKLLQQRQIVKVSEGARPRYRVRKISI